MSTAVAYRVLVCACCARGFLRERTVEHATSCPVCAVLCQARGWECCDLADAIAAGEVTWPSHVARAKRPDLIAALERRAERTDRLRFEAVLARAAFHTHAPRRGREE